MDPHLGRYPAVWAAAGLPTAVFAVPPATLRILANATVAPIAEERRAADIEAAARAAAGADRADRRQDRRNRATRPITYPGGLRARWRWAGSGQAAAVFALTEAGGTLIDLGPPRQRRSRTRSVGPNSASTDHAAHGRRASPR